MATLRRIAGWAAAHPLAVASAVMAIGVAAATWFVLNREEPIRGDRAQLAEALGGSSNNNSTPPEPPGANQAQQTSAAAAEMQALASRGDGQTVEAAYSATSPGTTPVTIHVWRTPTSFRQDSHGSPEVETRVLATGSGVVSCRRNPREAWACAAQPQLTRAAVDSLAVPTPAQLAGRAITARDDSVAARRVRCFVVDGAGPSEFCLDADGIVTRVVTGSSRVELVELLRGDIPATVFDPPARPAP